MIVLYDSLTIFIAYALRTPVQLQRNFLKKDDGAKTCCFGTRLPRPQFYFSRVIIDRVIRFNDRAQFNLIVV